MLQCVLGEMNVSVHLCITCLNDMNKTVLSQHYIKLSNDMYRVCLVWVKCKHIFLCSFGHLSVCLYVRARVQGGVSMLQWLVRMTRSL